jgi:hypothetical protein
VNGDQEGSPSGQKAKGIFLVCLGIFAILIGGMCSIASLTDSAQDSFDRSMNELVIEFSLVPLILGLFWLWFGWRTLRRK